MHFQVKMIENGRKNIFRDKQTANKVPLLFLHVKVRTERQQLPFWTLSTNKQGTVYLVLQNLKISSENGQRCHKAKSKVRIAFSRLKFNKIGAADAIIS